MSEWPYGLTLRPISAWIGEQTRNRKMSQFDTTLRKTNQQLQAELRAVGAKNPVMQIAMDEKDFRIDGYPRAQARATHPGVILSFETAKGALSFPCDTYTTWQDNLRAITLTLEKLRAIERYGVTKNNQQYDGWLALEARPMGSSVLSVEHAWEIIYDAASLSKDSEGASLYPAKVIRIAQRNTHPDNQETGDREKFERVVQAKEYLEAHPEG